MRSWNVSRATGAALRRLPLRAKFAVLAGAIALALAVQVWHAPLATAPPWALVLVGVCTAAPFAWLLAVAATLEADLRRLASQTARATGGNLRVQEQWSGRDETTGLGLQMNRMTAAVSAMVADIRSNSALVAHAGVGLAHGNRALSERTEQQAANLEQTAASVEELATTVQRNAETAESVSAQAVQVRDAARASAGAMAGVVGSVEAIQHGAQRMDDIIGVIDGIAFQTNILALNAAVEAARAASRAAALRWWRPRCACWPSARPHPPRRSAA